MNYNGIRVLKCTIGVFIIIIIWGISLACNDASVLLDICFSVEPGFYDEAFSLEINSNKKGKIYYTLDSSVPDENSILYRGSIRISDASLNDNVYSMRTDVSVDFYRDLLVDAGIEDYWGYDAPNELVDKATVIRAICIDEHGNKSDVITGVYFVDYQSKTGYQNMNVISIVTDPDNLFDYNSGIYVTGKCFDELCDNGSVNSQITPNYGWWNANYTQRGIDWEKPAEVYFFNESHKLILSGTYGVRVQGGSSRGMLPKSLNIFKRGKYGSDQLPGELLFGMYGELGSVNLYSGAHCMDTMLNDYLVNSVLREDHVGTRVFVPYALFLDGEYWGIYWLTPRYEAEYFESEYGVYEDDIIQVKIGSIEIGNPQDVDLYTSMVEDITDHDMSDPEEYARVGDIIDIQSCIDYYAVEIYIANTDWPDNNYALWRSRTTEPNIYRDGRWRWLVFDVNQSMSTMMSQTDFIQYAANRDPFFASLMDNEEFYNALINKLVALANNEFNPYHIERFVDDYELSMSDAMEKKYKRFYGNAKSINIFHAGCTDVKNFFLQRYQYIMENYGEEK